MRLTEEQEKILNGKEGEILQQAMAGLVKYGTAMGAEEFVPSPVPIHSFSHPDPWPSTFLPGAFN